MDYEVWLECAVAYAQARGLGADELPEGEQARKPHGMGESPATYVERAYAGRLPPTAEID